MDNFKWLLVVLLLSSSSAFSAVQWSAGLRVASEYEDNINRNDSDKQSENANSIGANVAVSAQESRYFAQASYAINKKYFANSTNQDNSTLTGRLRGAALLIPNRLHWNISHTQDDTRTDALLPDTPDNTEQRSVFTTGPQLSLYPSKRDRVSVSATYTDVDLKESSENNSERYTGDIVWSRLLTKLSSLNVSATHEESKFDSFEESDYKREAYSIGLTGSRSLFDYTVSIGINEIKRDFGESSDGEFYQVSLSKEFSRTKFAFFASKQLTDSVFGLTRFFQDEETGELIMEDTGKAVSIVERNDVVLRMRHELDPKRLALNASISQKESDGEGFSNVDQVTNQFDIGLNFSATSSLSFSGSLVFRNNNFNVAPEREDDSITAAFSTNYRITPRFNWGGAVSHQNNESTQKANEYEAWRVVTSLRYMFGI